MSISEFDMTFKDYESFERFVNYVQSYFERIFGFPNEDEKAVLKQYRKVAKEYKKLISSLEKLQEKEKKIS